MKILGFLLTVLPAFCVAVCEEKEPHDGLLYYGSISEGELYVSKRDFVESLWSPDTPPILAYGKLIEKARGLLSEESAKGSSEIILVNWIKLGESRWLGRFQFRVRYKLDSGLLDSEFRSEEILLLPNGGEIELKRVSARRNIPESKEPTDPFD